MATPYYVDLPKYEVPPGLDQSAVNGVSNALSSIGQGVNDNAMLQLKQNEDKRAQAELGIRQQEAASTLKDQALKQQQMEIGQHGAVAQAALNLPEDQQPAAAQQYLDTVPGLREHIVKNGFDPSKTNWLQAIRDEALGAQNPLDVQLTKAKISEAQANAQAAQQGGKEQIVKTGQDSWGHDQYSRFKPLTGEITPIQNPVNGAAAGPQDIVDGIVRGDLPPDLTGMYKQKAQIMATLAKTKGADGTPFNLETAQLQDKAARRQVITLNGAQTTKLIGLQGSVANTINEVDDLADQMKNVGVPLINAGKLEALKQTAGNTPQGQLAARYITAVNTLKEEFANAANGGYAPTDAAWKLANDQINGNFGHQQLRASLGEIQRLINYRIHAIPNIDKLGPGAANPYTGTGQPQGVGVGLGSGAPQQAAPQQTAAPVRVSTPEEAMKLPSGTTFVTPDGRTKVRP